MNITEYKPRVCFTISDLKAANKEAGNRWFSKDTMRFWGSKIAKGLIHNSDGDTYFVTSEYNFHKTARFYTVRCLRYATGEVDTVSEFQGYDTLAKARSAMKFIAGRTK